MKNFKFYLCDNQQFSKKLKNIFKKYLKKFNRF